MESIWQYLGKMNTYVAFDTNLSLLSLYPKVGVGELKKFQEMKIPYNKYFHLYKPYILCHNYSILSLSYENRHRQYINKWVRLCSNTTLFTQRDGGPDWANKYSLLTPALKLNLIHNDKCIRMFIAALLVIEKIRNNLRPSLEEWIVVYMSSEVL